MTAPPGRLARGGGPESSVYTDVHCHLLPGVDDGVKTWAEAMECLQIARAEKISRIVATAHIWPGRYPNDPADLRDVFAELKRRAEPQGFEMHLASEVYFQLELPELHRAGRLIPVGESGRYLLVELSLTLYPPGVARTFYALRIQGVEPVLVHPERYPYVARDPARIEELGRAGIPFQLTTHSVAGFFGSSIQKAAFNLLERGWGKLLASDAHSSTGRVPMFREAVRVLANRYGKEAARRLCIENPRRLVAGEPLLSVECVRRGRKR
jgi:protein-tyrosine phosphatase